jgi:hypothetical protein
MEVSVKHDVPDRAIVILRCYDLLTTRFLINFRKESWPSVLSKFDDGD